MRRVRHCIEGIIALAMAAFFVACTGGLLGGGSDDGGLLEPKTSFSDDDIRHLLVRTHFGVKQSEYDRAVSQGVPAFVDAMVEFPPIGSTQWEQDADLLLRNAGDPPGLEGGFPSARQLAQWWIHLMVHNQNPFQENLAFFWHDHFAASSSVLDGSRRYWMKSHINLFREKGTGNLRQLLVDMARDSVMLTWLDNVISTRTNPNENFAREFWELFTLGVDNGYTEDDIKEAARAFTGYRSRFDSTTNQSFIEFDPTRHDPGFKVFLGQVLRGQDQTDDYQAVVDLTLDNMPVAEFFAKKILEYFCCENPPPALINGLADVMRANDYELKPVFRTLFKSKAFYSSVAKAGLVRSPVEYSIGFVRTTGLLATESNTDNALLAMHQRPTQPPDVNGWPRGTLWLSAQGMIERANFLRRCIVSRDLQSGVGISVADLLPAGRPTAEEVVDRLAWLLRVTLSPDERATCVTYLDTIRQADGQTVASPFDPTDNRHLEERVRGLLYILGQHPSYLIR